MWSKIFRSFMLFATKIFKTISVKEMEPNFVRMKVPELKKYLQVRGVSVANKRREEFLDLSVKDHSSFFSSLSFYI